MNTNLIRKYILISAVVFTLAGLVTAQSSRPRRVRPAQQPVEEPLLRPEPTPNPTARNTSNRPLVDVQPVKPVVNTVGRGDTSHAYQLLQQKRFAEAAKEAKGIAAQFPGDAEAWKIAGFAELNLKQYDAATEDLQKAMDFRRLLSRKTRTPLTLWPSHWCFQNNLSVRCRCS